MQISNINREFVLITVKLSFLHPHRTETQTAKQGLHHQRIKYDKSLWELCLLLAVSCKGACLCRFVAKKKNYQKNY